jgi:hypothetical protein
LHYYILMKGFSQKILLCDNHVYNVEMNNIDILVYI